MHQNAQYNVWMKSQKRDKKLVHYDISKVINFVSSENSL